MESKAESSTTMANLDGLDPEELLTFALQYLGQPARAASELFGIGDLDMTEIAQHAARQVVTYAFMRIIAINFRLQRDVANTLLIETHAEIVYQSLPPYARW